MQAFIQVIEQKFVVVKKKLEKLEVAKKQVQEYLTARSSKLESLQAQLATTKFLSEKNLRVQAFVKFERTCQQEIQRFRDHIYSLTERD